MSRAKGNLAEDAAARYLASLGYEILDRNYAVRGGEIDIIAREGDFVVFVEVKARENARYAAPREAVTPAKRRRICGAALLWLQERGMAEANVRFDVVESVGGGLTLLRAAFDFTA